MKAGLFAAALAAALAGCQTTPDEKFVFVRVDGKRLAENPSYGTKFELDRSVCVGDVQKSAVGAPPIYYQGLSGAISASIIANRQQSALLDIFRGCMVSKGYAMVPESQAPAVHASFKANPQPMPGG